MDRFRIKINKDHVYIRSNFGNAYLDCTLDQFYDLHQQVIATEIETTGVHSETYRRVVEQLNELPTHEDSNEFEQR